jgi:hypothetical protein
MPISRPLLVALVAAVLLGAVFLVTRGGGEASESVTPTPAFLGDEDRAPEPSEPEPEPANPGAGDSEDSTEAQTVPAQVETALERDRVAVIVLYQPGAADDEATLGAVRSLEEVSAEQGKSRGGVEVFTDRLTNAGDYLGVTAALGVSQAPAVAIVRPAGEARLLEGFQDGNSLRQHVADAL